MEFLLRNTHVVTVECLNEVEVKGKECSSRLMELNIACCCWRGEESMAMKKIHMMVMMELWLRTPKLRGTVNGRETLFSQRLCSMG